MPTGLCISVHKERPARNYTLAEKVQCSTQFLELIHCHLFVLPVSEEIH